MAATIMYRRIVWIGLSWVVPRLIIVRVLRKTEFSAASVVEGVYRKLSSIKALPRTSGILITTSITERNVGLPASIGGFGDPSKAVALPVVRLLD